MHQAEEADIAHLRVAKCSDQSHDQVPLTGIWYRLINEIAPERYFEINSTVTPNCWYFICELLERFKMPNYYLKLDTAMKQNKHVRSADCGGFVAIFQHQLASFREAQSRGEGQTWLEQHFLPPLHQFDTANAHVLLVRIPQNLRKEWVDKRFGSKWLNDLPFSTNEEAAIAALMTKAPKPSKSYLFHGNGNAHSKIQLPGFPIRTRRSDKPDEVLRVRGIYCLIPKGHPKTDFVQLSEVIDQIDNELLIKLAIYDLDNSELVLKQELTMNNISFQVKRRRDRKARIAGAFVPPISFLYQIHDDVEMADAENYFV